MRIVWLVMLCLAARLLEPGVAALDPPPADDAEERTPPPRHVPGHGTRPAPTQGPRDAWAELFADALAEQHGIEQWRRHPAVRARIEFEAEGHPPFRGTLWIETGTPALRPPGGSPGGGPGEPPVTRTPDSESRATGRVRIERDDGLVLIAANDGMWAIAKKDNNDVDVPAAVFHLRALPHFLAIPFLLHQQETHLRGGGLRRVEEERYHAVMLRYPQREDDWFAVFAHPFQNRVGLLAYVVRTGAMPEPAVGPPQAHVIVYGDEQTTEGVMLPRSWTIRRWSRLDEFTSDVIGKGRVVELEFVSPSEGWFDAPEGAVALQSE
jgi:hypothetical protein